MEHRVHSVGLVAATAFALSLVCAGANAADRAGGAAHVGGHMGGWGGGGWHGGGWHGGGWRGAGLGAGLALGALGAYGYGYGEPYGYDYPGYGYDYPYGYAQSYAYGTCHVPRRYWWRGHWHVRYADEC